MEFPMPFRLPKARSKPLYSTIPVPHTAAEANIRGAHGCKEKRGLNPNPKHFLTVRLCKVFQQHDAPS